MGSGWCAAYLPIPFHQPFDGLSIGSSPNSSLGFLTGALPANSSTVAVSDASLCEGTLCREFRGRYLAIGPAVWHQGLDSTGFAEVHLDILNQTDVALIFWLNNFVEELHEPAFGPESLQLYSDVVFVSCDNQKRRWSAILTSATVVQQPRGAWVRHAYSVDKIRADPLLLVPGSCSRNLTVRFQESTTTSRYPTTVLPLTTCAFCVQTASST